MRRRAKPDVSVLFSEPKIPQFCRSFNRSLSSSIVSVLFSEPKIPQSSPPRPKRRRRACVSVLFSEPKIPQFIHRARGAPHALRFQCSSASRKFLNCASSSGRSTTRTRFSALQRAENSSIEVFRRQRCVYRKFQCSSASRKFLNLRAALRDAARRAEGFSALQRAENSSM